MHVNRNISRRAMLTGPQPPRHHISSAVVMALPARREQICGQLQPMPGVEVHAAEGSRIVVTIEGPTSGMLGETLSRISIMDGVISANMVFEHVEDRRPADNDAELNRRDLLKAHAAALAAATAGIALPAAAQPVPGGVGALEIKWSKAPCRFCGTGCGVMVGVKDGQVVATHGDMQAEVNRGLNCVKGYFLSKIMYGADRLTTPLMRKRGGVFDKEGEFEPVSWDEAFDMMAEKMQAGAEGEGADGGRHVRLRAVDDLRGLCRDQADAGRLPLQQSRSQCAPLHGVRRLRLHAHIRHGRADGLLRRFRGMPTPSCCGARTWPRCTRSCGRGWRTGGSATRTCAARCCRPSRIARWTSPTFRSSSSRVRTSRSSTTSPTTSSRRAASTRRSCATTPPS